jgi:hypothetical protein
MQGVVLFFVCRASIRSSLALLQWVICSIEQIVNQKMTVKNSPCPHSWALVADHKNIFIDLTGLKFKILQIIYYVLYYLSYCCKLYSVCKALQPGACLGPVP